MPGWKTGLAVIAAGGAFFAGTMVGQRRAAAPAPAPLPASVPIDAPRAEPESDPLTRAWKLVVEHPRDASAWLVLGDLESEHGEPEAAEHSYRTAVTLLSSTSAQAYARLGFFFYGRGDDASALPLLLEAKRRGSVDPVLDFTLGVLDGGLPPDAGSPVADAGPPTPEAVDSGADAGTARSDCIAQLTRAHAGGAYVAEAMLDGAPAHLLIDTGATVSVLNREFVARLGASEDPRPMRVLTANGKATLTRATIQSFGVGGRVAQNVMVGVCDDCVHGVADGLLGLDVQAMLGMELELGNGRIRFADCDR